MTDKCHLLLRIVRFRLTVPDSLISSLTRPLCERPGLCVVRYPHIFMKQCVPPQVIPGLWGREHPSLVLYEHTEHIAKR